MAYIHMALWFALFSVAIFVVYVPVVALYQRIRNEYINWRVLCMKAFNFSVSFYITICLGILAVELIRYLHHAIDLPAIYTIVFLSWFGIFFALHLLKNRGNVPPRYLAALKAAFGDILFIAITQVIAFLFWREKTLFFLSLFPVLQAYNILDRTFFPWGKGGQPGTQQEVEA